MSDKAWKQLERDAARLFGGARFWANAGAAIDFEATGYVGQCKHRRTMSLEELTQLAEQAERDGVARQKIGVVVVQRKRGRGRKSPMLIVVTEAMWREMNGPDLNGDSPASGSPQDGRGRAGRYLPLTSPAIMVPGGPGGPHRAPSRSLREAP